MSEEWLRNVVLIRDARMVDANGNVLWEGQALSAKVFAPLLGDVDFRQVVVQVPERSRPGMQAGGDFHWDSLSADLKSMYGPLRRAGVSKDKVFQCASLLMEARETLACPTAAAA